MSSMMSNLLSIEEMRQVNEKLGDKKKILNSLGAIVSKNCGTCKFMRKNDRHDHTCRRRSPRHCYDFPQVFSHDWCGEYQYEEKL